MAKIKLKSAALSSDSSVNAPTFRFMAFEPNKRLENNATNIDFVTDGKSLYVCAYDGSVTGNTIGESSSALLKIVSQGERGKDGNPGRDGAAGAVPEIGAEYIDLGGEKKLALTVGGKRKAMTDDLTPPVYVPVLENDRYLTWEWSNEDPAVIDLMKLRPLHDRPILLRTNSDNTKLEAEASGPANFIQWKYEGDPYWTNLISIQELMNLAFAGMATWEASDGKWHFGYREVLKATYDSTKKGRRVISRVELGDILFDAGELPLNDYEVDIELINQRLAELENSIPSLDGYATEDWVNAQGFLKEVPEVDAYTKNESDRLFQPKGDYVKGISVNGGTVNRPDNGIVNLEIEEGGQPVDAYNKSESDGRYIRGIKVNNGDVLPKDNDGIVNIAISAGETCLFDVKVEGNHLWKTSDGQNWIDLGSMGGGPSDPTDLTQLKLRVGDPDNDSERNHLFVSYDNGQTWIDAGEFIDTDTQYELQGYATIQMLEDLYYQKSVLYTKTEIDNMLSGGDVDLTSYRTFTIYQRSASNNENDIHLPNDNIVAVWNVSEGVLDLPSGYTDWTNHPENATTQKPYLWTASATFESKQGSRVSPWDGPFCLTGENGKEGADGKGIEFIYHLGPAGVNGAKPSAPSIDYSKSKKGSDVNNRSKSWWETEASTDSCPGDGNNGYWTDNPQGISDLENEKVEWASIRRSHYDPEEEATVWEDFCSPFIWSMWGEDGMDGDGVEYLFCVTATEEEMEVYRTYIPIIGETYQDFDTRFPDYQTDDWYPKEAGGTPKKWTDNPLDVSENQPYEWVAIRKFNGSTGSWGYFSEPKVWGLWGQKTIVQPSDTYYYYRPYTSYIFARSTEDLTERVLKTTWEYNNQTYAQWIGEDPNRKMAFYNNPLAYLITLKRDPNDNSQWIIDPDVVWHDSIPEAESPIHDLYLATNLIGDEEEEETAWDGPVRWGDSVGFQTEYAISDENTDAVYAKLKTLPVLDAYETADPTHDPDEDGIDEDSWRTYVQQNAMGVWKDDNSIVDPTYMATCHKKANGHWSAWVVTKIKGEKSTEPGPTGKDGTNIEFVYFRTDSESHRPGMSETYGTYDGQTKISEDLYEDDFFPMATGAFLSDPNITKDTELHIGNDLFWHDHPAGVTEQLPCEWVGMRHTSYDLQGDKVWGEFNIALWSKYGANGRDGDGIEYVFWGLSDEDVANLASTWPTQQAANAQNNGENVDPTRLDDAAERAITDNEYLPALIMKTSTREREAVDNNPGIENNKYVFASMRRYNGATGTWGEFSEIKLWNEQSASNLEKIVLDIKDDSHTIVVDENGRVTDRYMNYSGYSTDGMYLYKDMVLLGNGNVSVVGNSGDVVLAELIPNAVQSNCYSKTNNTAVITSKGVTATVSASWAWKYENSNSSTIELKVVFDKVNGQNPVLNDSFDITIKVQSADGLYVASDILRLVPRSTDELILNHVPGTQRTSSEASGDYSDSEFNFYGYYGSTYVPLSIIEKTSFWFKYDNQVNWTKFQVPTNDVNLINLRNNVDGHQEGAYTFYFDRTGSILSNSTGAFYKIWMYNRDWVDNIHGEWTNWMAQGYIIPSAFVASEDYPVNELYFGVGFDNEILDEANVHIIYPGKDGQKGEKGDPGETIVTYQYLDGKIVRLSDWTDNQLEYSDGTTDINGVSYLDVVRYISGQTTSYYKCIQSVTYTNNKPASPASDSTHWQAYTPQADSWFETMIANSAYIDNLTAKQVVITDGTGQNAQIVAGMASGSDIASASGNQTVGDVRIWAGTPTTTGDLTTAPFTVDNDGAVKASNINIAGGTISGNLVAETSTSQATFNGTSLEIIDKEESSSSYTNNSISIDKTNGFKNVASYTGNSGTRTTTAFIHNGQFTIVNDLDARSSYWDDLGSHMVTGGTLISTYNNYGFGRYYSDPNNPGSRHDIGSVLGDLSIRFIKKLTQSEYDALAEKLNYVLYIITDN